MPATEVRPRQLERLSATITDEKTVIDPSVHPPKRIKIELPLDIVLSLLRPDELEKLQKYVTAYLDTHRV